MRLRQAVIWIIGSRQLGQASELVDEVLRPALPHGLGKFLGGDELAASQLRVRLGQPVASRFIVAASRMISRVSSSRSRSSGAIKTAEGLPCTVTITRSW